MIGKNVKGAVIALAWIVGAAFVSLLVWTLAQGCVPRFGSRENKSPATAEAATVGDHSPASSESTTSGGDSTQTKTDATTSTTTGDNSRVTTITFALTEYGPYGVVGGVLLLLGRLYGWRSQRIDHKAAYRIMSTLQRYRLRPKATPNDVILSLSAFDDPVERRINRIARKFPKLPDCELAESSAPRVEGSTNQE